MISGPEICQLVKSFELSSSDHIKKTSHHEDIPSEQKKFLRDVNEMQKSLRSMGTHF